MAVETFNLVTDFAPRQTSRRSHAVYTAMQRQIVLGEVAPEQTLTELDLAERFECSQGTIREALMRLNEEGLVNRQPNRGTVVAPCREDDARALLRLRREVECSYLDRVLERSGADLTDDLHGHLNAMRNAARDKDEHELSVHDRAFHSRLFAAADLPLLLPILTRCLIHNHRYKILRSEPNRALIETAERHVPIIDAVRDSDLDGLRDLLGHHIATIVDLGPDLAEGRAG